MRAVLLSLLSVALLAVGVSGQGGVCTSGVAGAASSPPARGWMQVLSPPSVIPASGTVTGVVSYYTNFAGLMNLHFDLSDITSNYTYDGGAFAQVMGPSAGTVTMQLPIAIPASVTGTSLLVTDMYQLHTYMTSAANSSCYGANSDYLNAIYNGYNGVSVSTAALTNSMTLLNPPSYIPTTGFFVGEVAYTSNIPSWSYLHMDLNDESNQYAYDGGASLNVTTPGAGTIQLNMSIATALTLQDTIGIHLYMASAVNYNLYSAGQANNMDWNHSSFSVYYTALGAPQTQFGNNITIPSPPANIPSTGSFTVQVQWYSNITGLINLHCDLSDISLKYAYDGGGLTQVTGPGAGLATITVQLSTAAAAADMLQLHTYMLDEATSLMYQTSAGNNDWNYTLFNAYYPVGILGAGQACTASPTATPSNNGARGWMQVLSPPTVIPASGTVTAVVSYWTNYNGLMNLHFDLSDVTANYTYDGGAFAQVMGPTSGQATMQLSIAIPASVLGGALTLSDTYQLHTYMTSAQNSTCYGSGYDWQNAIFNGYNGVTVSAAALTNSMTLLNPPSYIPTTGFFVGEVAYTSNIPSWSYLHMDLNDESNQYAYDGGASLNVTTPGAGTIQLNMSIATALTLQDTIGIHLYMASAVNYNLYSAGQANNMDWNHSSFSVYYTALGAPQTQFGNNITIPSPPANIPSTGSFTVQVQWYSNITGLINLHCDLSDISLKYAYDGGGLTQVTGPGAGLATITVQLSTAAAAADMLQLHTYMLDEATSLMYQTSAGNNDWNYTLFNAYYPVGILGAGQACTASPTATPSNNGARGWMQVLSPPTVIPASGTVTAVVSYWTNYNGLMNLHFDLSDVTANYTYDGGAFAQVMGPTSGQATMQLSIAIPASVLGGALTLSDTYQLHTYMTSAQNLTCYGSGYDWQNAIFNGYNGVTVSAAALTNSMTLLNPPSYIPTTGFFVGEVAYTSNIPSWSYLHMDLNDESNQYAYDGGASLNVTTPGAGTIQLNMSIATALTLQDTIGIHLYMASAVNYNLYSAGQANNMDWNHSSFSVYYTALGAPQTQFGNNITIPSPPANIPSTGSFTVQVQWYSNITGLINLHCDLSDISLKYAYDGGGLTQVTGPGRRPRHHHRAAVHGGRGGGYAAAAHVHAG